MPDRPDPDASGPRVRVAIVDSGVHAGHPHVGGVAGGVDVTGAGIESGDYADRLGHGTAVTAVIREKAPRAELFAVRVFTTSLATQLTRLVQAVDWAIANHMHLVNLSLGTAEPAHEPVLRALIERTRAAGVLIVAARDDGERRWWPGCLPGVVPVRPDASCPRHECDVDWEPDGPVFRASPYARPIPGVPLERNLNGVSFAVANMTGLIARVGVPALRALGDTPLPALTAAVRESRRRFRPAFPTAAGAASPRG